jgi:hypothetical protein
MVSSGWVLETLRGGSDLFLYKDNLCGESDEFSRWIWDGHPIRCDSGVNSVGGEPTDKPTGPFSVAPPLFREQDLAV